MAIRIVDQAAAFRHEALLYEGKGGFLEGTLPFIREGLRADEPVMVVVPQEKIDWLTAELGDDAGWVEFADMDVVGRNPARLIGLWRSFTESHAYAPALRGIGEPATATRDPEELDECRRHESLLNQAFDDERDFWLLCPYDTTALPRVSVDGARATHPLVCEHGEAQPSDAFTERGGTLSGPLARVPDDATTLEFGEGDLRAVRSFTEREALARGMAPGQVVDLVFAAGELAANSVRHGGGGGSASVWRDGDAIVLEVRDPGVLADPLVGRLQPRVDQIAGRGMWLVNQLCDLVQLRSGARGTTVRVHLALARANAEAPLVH